jgi:hypothetical protein
MAISIMMQGHKQQVLSFKRKGYQQQDLEGKERATSNWQKGRNKLIFNSWSLKLDT